MKLLLSSLLLASLCALSSWSVSSGTLVVDQIPNVSVSEGETLKISCCWRGDAPRVRVTWLKNQTTLKEEIFISEKISAGSPQKETSHCSHLTFLNITREDAGRYICRLTREIPRFTEVEGYGTIITVTEKENSVDYTGEEADIVEPTSSALPLPAIVSLAVLAPLLLIGLLYFCALRRKRALAAMVIYEIPHIDSEVAEMDKHSTSSSTGSSQWCQVPVYESFDYFERVQNKESG